MSLRGPGPWGEELATPSLGCGPAARGRRTGDRASIRRGWGNHEGVVEAGLAAGRHGPTC